MRSKYSKRGFSAVEILIVLAVFGILLAGSMIMLGMLRSPSDLEADVRAFQQVLELTRNRTIASEGDTRYGVYIDTGVNPHEYILFRGNDYATGVEDQVHQLRNTIEFNAPTFIGLSGQEVVFDRVEGTTSNIGNVVLRIKAEPTQANTVYVESSGAVAIDTAGAPSGGECVSAGGDRLCDSRHVHVDYNGRTIDTLTESIILDFGTATETIVINDNLSGGQIVWEGTVQVDGEDQVLKIHTHSLNSGAGSNETQFSVHRDLRFNTKPLRIEASGDGGLSLIEYDATGNTTQGTSVYASAPDLQ